MTQVYFNTRSHFLQRERYRQGITESNNEILQTICAHASALAFD